MTLLGFRSRWTMPLAWAASRAWAMDRSACSFWRRSMRGAAVRSVSPSMNSMAMKALSRASTQSCT